MSALPKADRIWAPLPWDEAATTRLAPELRLSEVRAGLLCRRGLSEIEDARRSLHPPLDDLHDPFALAGRRVAVDRVLGAIERKERIAIHGDYDVDGVTSTVI